MKNKNTSQWAIEIGRLWLPSAKDNKTNIILLGTTTRPRSPTNWGEREITYTHAFIIYCLNSFLGFGSDEEWNGIMLTEFAFTIVLCFIHFDFVLITIFSDCSLHCFSTQLTTRMRSRNSDLLVLLPRVQPGIWLVFGTAEENTQKTARADMITNVVVWCLCPAHYDHNSGTTMTMILYS